MKQRRPGRMQGPLRKPGTNGSIMVMESKLKEVLKMMHRLESHGQMLAKNIKSTKKLIEQVLRLKLAQKVPLKIGKHIAIALRDGFPTILFFPSWDMIRVINTCKTATEERMVVQRECAAIRAAISEGDNDYCHMNMFSHMLGNKFYVTLAYELAHDSNNKARDTSYIHPCTSTQYNDRSPLYDKDSTKPPSESGIFGEGSSSSTSSDSSLGSGQGLAKKMKHNDEQEDAEMHLCQRQNTKTADWLWDHALKADPKNESFELITLNTLVMTVKECSTFLSGGSVSPEMLKETITSTVALDEKEKNRFRVIVGPMDMSYSCFTMSAVHLGQRHWQQGLQGCSDDPNGGAQHSARLYAGIPPCQKGSDCSNEEPMDAASLCEPLLEEVNFGNRIIFSFMGWPHEQGKVQLPIEILSRRVRIQQGIVKTKALIYSFNWYQSLISLLGLTACRDHVRTQTPTEEYDKNEHKNAQATNALLSALSPSEFKQVDGIKSAKEIWNTLRNVHEGIDGVHESKVEILKGQLERFVLKPKLTPSEMYDQLSKIVNEIKRLGCKDMTNSYVVKKMLRAITPRNSTGLTPKRQDIALKAVKEAKVDKGCASQAEDDMTLFVRRLGKYMKRSGFFKGGPSKSSFGKSSGRRSSRKYFECGETGHFIAECPKLDDDKERFCLAKLIINL
uniref:CCHC-type domain-containing protein n=1 Tax=Oryza brachyantha TaxID=4533 RepID=J3LV23_ORYBR